MTPLQGIRVLALEQAVAGPLCTRHLADLGAEVIKIERPGGGDFARTYDRTVNGLSSYFVWLNRGKRSLSLDLKHPSAREVLDRLIESSDVLVQNLGPGAIDRLGYPPSALRARFPSLIVCGISGYGSSGPYVNRKAFDLLLQGETGVIATTGDGESMAKLGISVGDIGAGVYGAMGVLAALFERETTGHGKIVETSLFDALAEFMGYPAYYTLYSGSPPARAGVRHATVVPYGAYRCGDGQQVLFAVQTDQQWRSFCATVAQHPEWIDDPRFDSPTNRRVHRDILENAIEAAFAHLSRVDINQRLETADIPFSDLNDIHQFLEHPQLTERDRWREIDSPAGPIQAILPPWTMEDTELAMGAIPAVGGDTDAILGELGFDPTAVIRLRENHAI
ncbi:MAG: CaiB/BaiF CoA transferase family protein [Thermomicrobiales bacterium]